MNLVYIDVDYKSLIPAFMKRRHEDVKHIHALCDAKDFVTLKRLGHSMKGTALNYGFDYIGEIGKSLEELAVCSAGKKDCDDIRKLAKDLEHYLNTVKIEYVEIGGEV